MVTFKEPFSWSKDNFCYMLAPLEDITGNAFRTICYRYGADLTFTVMTRVEGLAKRNKSTWSRLEFHDDTPTVIQLVGAGEQYFKKFLSEFRPHPGFQGFNLNLGCPSPDIVALGQGCVMSRRISKTRKIVEIFKERGFPISVKMRLGLTARDKTNKVYLNLLRGVEADFFIVHARYGLQGYTTPADFSVYEECVSTGRKIIANGDIKTQEQIDDLKSIGVIGAMIGRAAISDPLIFRRLQNQQVPLLQDVLNEYKALAQSYQEPFKYQKNILKRAGTKYLEFSER